MKSQAMNPSYFRYGSILYEITVWATGIPRQYIIFLRNTVSSVPKWCRQRHSKRPFLPVSLIKIEDPNAGSERTVPVLAVKVKQ